MFGDERFLRRLAVNELRQQVLGQADAEFSLTRFDGETAQMRDVMDELSTVALFGGGRRLVVIDDADDFVSEHRAELEDYVATPKASGVLVLEISAWPKTTRLYKALDSERAADRLQGPGCTRAGRNGLTSWSRSGTERSSNPRRRKCCVEIVGPELGLLDQELAKLAVSDRARASRSASNWCRSWSAAGGPRRPGR